MIWEQIKDKIYYEDGSLRDILILETTQEDWKKWVNLVNTNYKVSTRMYETDQINNIIDFTEMLEFWSSKIERCFSTTIFLDNILINAFYFDSQEIENDICPKEIKSLEDHNKLINYMTKISVLLNKKVVMTPENSRDIILISVEKEKIEINLK